MTTTELIKILQDNETGAISLKPREISLTINGRCMPNPQITLSSTGDGICGAEIDLDINGEWLEQEPKTGHCKDCKHFEYDSVANVNGIPLIVAHEICKKWGDGCKTREDGYCFLFEPQEMEDKE